MIFIISFLFCHGAMEKKKKTTRNVNQGTPLIWRVALYFCICEYNHDQKIQISRYWSWHLFDRSRKYTNIQISLTRDSSDMNSKYKYTQIHKYTKIQIHKNTNTQSLSGDTSDLTSSSLLFPGRPVVSLQPAGEHFVCLFIWFVQLPLKTYQLPTCYLIGVKLLSVKGEN